MGTWTKQTQAADEWTSQYNVLYLLTEARENMLYEDGDLILISQGGTGTYTEEAEPTNTWTIG